MDILSIVLIAVLIVIGLFVAYVTLRGKKKDEFRVMAYDFILKAEHYYKEPGQGFFKKCYVVEKLHEVLPGPIRLFITDDILDKLVQIWFDEVKDLLDDGKINKSL